MSSGRPLTPLSVAGVRRRSKALQGLAIVKNNIYDINKQTSNDLKYLKKLIQDYDSKPEDFDKMFASVLAKREHQVIELWDDRQAMLVHIKPGEWQKIVTDANIQIETKLAEKKKI